MLQSSTPRAAQATAQQTAMAPASTVHQRDRNIIAERDPFADFIHARRSMTGPSGTSHVTGL
jgi:hypothetical protein